MAINQKTAQSKLGAVIRARRGVMGFSQESFASECGVHRTYMGAVERGERNVSLLNIMRISEALNIKASELLVEAKL